MTQETASDHWAASCSNAGIGAWEVWPGKGYNSRPFWTLMRRNPAWALGWESLTTPSKRGERRFYDETKAKAFAGKLNGDAHG